MKKDFKSGRPKGMPKWEWEESLKKKYESAIGMVRGFFYYEN